MNGRPGFLNVDPVQLPRGPLGDVEERLRQELEQEGPLPIALDYGIVPVTLVADATRPGRATLRGRSWSKQFNAVATGVNCGFLLPQAAGYRGFEIESFITSYTAATAVGDSFDIYQYAPGVAAPITPATVDVEYIEGFIGGFAPILSGAGAGAPTRQSFLRFTLPIAAGTQPAQQFFLRSFFLAGATVLFRPVLTGPTMTLTVIGRMF